MMEEDVNLRDIVIELRTEVRGMRADIKDLRDGTSQRIKDLETDKADKDVVEMIQTKVNNDIEVRVRELEECKIEPKEHKALLAKTNNYLIVQALYTVFVAGLTGLIIYHIFR